MYIPLSQITTNLYTNGNEYSLINTNQTYTGYYWKNSKGKFFTGKTPQDTPITQLIPINVPITTTNGTELRNDLNSVEYVIDSTDAINYNAIKNINTDKELFLPAFNITLPTEKDYKIGEFKRYFCKKASEITYLEISKDTYDKLINKDSSLVYALYLPFSINWKLTGDEKQVYIINRNIVELTSKNLKLYKFKEYLRNDFAKYYK